MAVTEPRFALAKLVVPSATIQRASFGTFVYVIKPDNTATIRKVVLGAAEGERVAVTEGLEPGERVVLEGVDALREGIGVEIVTGSAGDPATRPATSGSPPATGAPGAGAPSTGGAPAAAQPKGRRP